jgi:hypothetical protein
MCRSCKGCPPGIGSSGLVVQRPRQALASARRQHCSWPRCWCRSALLFEDWLAAALLWYSTSPARSLAVAHAYARGSGNTQILHCLRVCSTTRDSRQRLQSAKCTSAICANAAAAGNVCSMILYGYLLAGEPASSVTSCICSFNSRAVLCDLECQKCFSAVRNHG